MALITTISINDKPLYFVDAVRTEGGEDPDDLNIYQVRVFSGENMRDQKEFYIKHRYGDGALKLSRTVLHFIADMEKEEE